jgi:hypothetical protein
MRPFSSFARVRMGLIKAGILVPAGSHESGGGMRRAPVSGRADTRDAVPMKLLALCFQISLICDVMSPASGCVVDSWSTRNEMDGRFCCPLSLLLCFSPVSFVVQWLCDEEFLKCVGG